MNKQQIVVGDWMSSPAHTVCLHTPVGDAYKLMMKYGIRRLPVVAGEALVGIVRLANWDGEIEHLVAKVDSILLQLKDKYYALLRALCGKVKEIKSNLQLACCTPSRAMAE